ncbi:MAG: hypothetical protein JO347_07600, partial [Candidatus Eremiobacteraeota bacterium]|nr:hypothetical protein [Candidatus Eremiobacteraeota bacterium]
MQYAARQPAVRRPQITAGPFPVLSSAARYAALVIVAAGASAGFFAWYVGASRAHALTSDLALALFVVAGSLG